MTIRIEPTGHAHVAAAGFPLRGRTALITGAGRNIGRAIALGLARLGAHVVVNGHRDAAALDAVAVEARRVSAGSGAGAMAVLADVADPAAVRAMVDAAVARFGSVDIAVSNVSVRLHQPFLEISVADWNRVLDTNLSAAFHLAQACLPHMVAGGWGRIIHISGRDGFFPKANRAHNVTCKAGTFALAKAIAVEFGAHGITANAIAPGIVDTTRDAAQYPDAGAGFEARRQAMPLRRFGHVDDIAGACGYLCSDGRRLRDRPDPARQRRRVHGVTALADEDSLPITEPNTRQGDRTCVNP